MRNPSDRRATFKDLESVPDHQVGEIVGGTLYVSPRPAPVHANASSALGGELMGPFQFGRGGPGGWWIIDEPELRLGDDVLVPDLAGWRRERLPALPSEPAFTLAPDWVCEVLSPSTMRLDLARKLPWYARAGVQHAWVLHPLARTLQVLRRQDKMWLVAATFEGEQKVHAEPFDATALDLALLWDTGAPPAP